MWLARTALTLGSGVIHYNTEGLSHDPYLRLHLHYYDIYRWSMHINYELHPLTKYYAGGCCATHFTGGT